MRRLEDFLGPDAVTFTDGDTPTLAVKASKSEWQKAQKLLEPLQLPIRLRTCVICDEKQVELLKLPNCGHKACKDCLIQYCAVGTNRPLQCFAAAGCRTVIPMAWLEDKLPKTDVHDLADSVVKEHCKRNLDSYVPCAGLNCDEFLATSKRFNEVICPKCLTVNCTACKIEYHFSKTCGQYQNEIEAEKEDTERQLREGGAKRCPRCETPSYKAYGCNHITCTQCNAHWCWVCRLPFPDGEAVYRHLTGAHGGYGLDEDAILLQEARDAVAEGALRFEQLEGGLQQALAPVPGAAQPRLRALDGEVRGLAAAVRALVPW